jgi:hypothetical protein
MRSRLLPLLTAFVSITLATGHAHAQAWRDQIDAQLLTSPTVHNLLANRYVRTHDLHYGVLPARTSDDVTMTLHAGVTYKLVGKCDADCLDLDFALFDRFGTLLDSDTLDDDYPVVTVTPRRTETYRLRVSVHSCRTRDCGWGVVVLGR